MLFIWTSEGGPLQYIGLFIFLLQLAPHVLPQRNFDSVTSMALGLLCGILMALGWHLRTMGTAAIRQRLTQWTELARTRLQQATRREWSYYTIPAVIGITLGFFVMVGSTVDLIRWMPYIGQLATILSILGFGHQQDRYVAPQNTAAARQAKMEQLTALVGSMPLEPFISEEEMATAPISQLKQMLARRGTKQNELNSFVERQNLLEALHKKRKYSDTCCICFEEYAEDEPLRVLPKCCHELHVECLDKWVYTFANNAAKLGQDPTCPLCKEGLK